MEAPTERFTVVRLVVDMARDQLGRPEEGALRRFVAAVLALSDDPRPNIERYLAASRELERSRSGPSPAPLAVAAHPPGAQPQ